MVTRVTTLIYMSSKKTKRMEEKLRAILICTPNTKRSVLEKLTQSNTFSIEGIITNSFDAVYDFAIKENIYYCVTEGMDKVLQDKLFGKWKPNIKIIVE